MLTNKEIFSRYPNPIFIQSRSLHGDGIQAALDAGFKTVYSKVLGEVLMKIGEPVTFWLDGRDYSGVIALGDKETPLMEELYAIRLHPIKTHTILIDDLRCWNKARYRFDVDDLHREILKINKDYGFKMETGHQERDILAAFI